MMLIALPWILERRHVSNPDIAMNLGVFYATSLLSLGISGKWMEGWNLSRTLRGLMLILGIVSASALLVNSPLMILILRAIQGLVSGLMRPLNQIWLIQMADSKASHTERAQQAAMSQVFIGCGTMLGAFLGAHIGASELNSYAAGIAFALPAMIGALWTPSSPHKLGVCQGSGIQSHALVAGLRVLWENKRLGTIIMVYLTNMGLFKLWTVVYPMRVRGLPEGHGLNLTLILTLSPMFFLVGQLVITRLPQLLSSAKNAWNLLFGSALLQAVTMPIAILWPDTWVSGLIVCLIGGFVAAGIYPAMQGLIINGQTSLVEGYKNGVQLCVSAAADIGQVTGALLLAIEIGAEGVVIAMLFLALVLAGTYACRIAIPETKRCFRV